MQVKVNTLKEYELFLDRILENIYKDRKVKKEMKKLAMTVFHQGILFSQNRLEVEIDEKNNNRK